MIRVRYEDFCREPEAQFSALSDKIGIEVQDDQLDPAAYGETEGSMNEAHSRLHQPITPDSIGRWRQELSKDEVARIERTLADEMKALNYELTLE